VYPVEESTKRKMTGKQAIQTMQELSEKILGLRAFLEEYPANSLLIKKLEIERYQLKKEFIHVVRHSDVDAR
jgi:hypothetical protein